MTVVTEEQMQWLDRFTAEVEGRGPGGYGIDGTLVGLDDAGELRVGDRVTLDIGGDEVVVTITKVERRTELRPCEHGHYTQHVADGGRTLCVPGLAHTINYPDAEHT